VGIIGLSNSITHQLFSYLTPFILLLNLLFLLIFHSTKFSVNEILVYSTLFFFGYFIEVIGVNTGLVFGEYSYSYGLGIKIWNTPLMIGINWLLLSYIANSFTLKIPYSFLRIIIAAFIMVFYDFILEQTAGFLNLWFWSGNEIPIQNYVAWFVIALLFQFSFVWADIKTNNLMAKPILIIQFLFFSILYFLHTFVL
jgi:putative membrane protein